MRYFKTFIFSTYRLNDLGVLTKVQRYVGLITMDRELGASEFFPREYLPAFRSIWKDSGVQDAVQRGNEFALHDNLA